MGHLGRDIYESINNEHKYIINFRHPVNRVFFLYNYFRDDERLLAKDTPLREMNAFCVEAARSLSFNDFVASEHPYIRTWISDFQFKQIMSTPWIEGKIEGSIADALAFIEKALAIFFLRI